MSSSRRPLDPSRDLPRSRNGEFATIPNRVPTVAMPIPAGENLAAPFVEGELQEQFERFRAAAAEVSVSRSDAAEWAKTYHLRFRNFRADTLAATDVLFASRPSRLSAEERQVVMDSWVNSVSDIYGMVRPAMVWDGSANSTGGGYYVPSNHSITMSPDSASVITLIHETRHALQITGMGPPMVSSDMERDARAWSLSLYYQVRPVLFTRLVREGKVFHIDATVFDD